MGSDETIGMGWDGSASASLFVCLFGAAYRREGGRPLEGSEGRGVPSFGAELCLLQV